MPAVSVIVPAFDAAETIGATLAALAEQDIGEPYEVIVVDDGSSDETAAIAESSRQPVIVLRQESHGPGPARNRGAAVAEAPVLAFTDADCVPRPDWLRRGVERLADLDLLQGAVLPDPTAKRRPLDRSLCVDRESGLYETANLFVRRSAFRELDGFEDWLEAGIGKPLAEDMWFGWRARRAGARVGFDPEVVVEHAVFRRSPLRYLSDAVRIGYFPAMVARVPELRAQAMFHRLFLTRRSAAFDLALAGLVAWLAGAPALALGGALPYLWLHLVDAYRWRRWAPLAVTAGLARDAVVFAVLLAGSLRYRRPLL